MAQKFLAYEGKQAQAPATQSVPRDYYSTQHPSCKNVVNALLFILCCGNFIVLVIAIAPYEVAMHSSWQSNLSSAMQWIGGAILLSNTLDILSIYPMPVSVSIRAVAGGLLIFSGQIIAKMLASRGAFSPTLIPPQAIVMRLEKFATRYLRATPELPVRWNATTVKPPVPPDLEP